MKNKWCADVFEQLSVNYKAYLVISLHNETSRYGHNTKIYQLHVAIATKSQAWEIPHGKVVLDNWL